MAGFRIEQAGSIARYQDKDHIGFEARWGVLRIYCIGSHTAGTFDQLGWLL